MLAAVTLSWIGFSAILRQTAVHCDISLYQAGDQWIARYQLSNSSMTDAYVRVEEATIDGVPPTTLGDVWVPAREQNDIEVPFPKAAVTRNRAVQLKTRWCWWVGDDSHERMTEMWLAPDSVRGASYK